tara:strand:+ start:6617 stop:7534 length:918 start_codon:yes stop_codon:yes gene_type:complete
MLSKNKNMFSDSFTEKIKPATQNQRVYQKALDNKDVNVLIASGPAGTGKTHFACNKAIDMLYNGKINRIVITRPIVSVDNEEMGFLPGTINRKMAPWTRPIFDIFLEYYSQRDIDRMVDDSVIEIAPIAYMRGRTFKKCYVIADEMQNSTPIQMKMLLTRIGDETKMVITGDPKQTDLKEQENGFNDFLKRYSLYKKKGKKSDYLKVITMDHTDIMRSEVVKSIIDVYEQPNLKEEYNKLYHEEDELYKFNDQKVKEAINKLIKHNDNGSLKKERSTDTTNSMDCAMVPKSQQSKRFDEDKGTLL